MNGEGWHVTGIPGFAAAYICFLSATLNLHVPEGHQRVILNVLIPAAAENLCDIVHANAKEMLSTRHRVEQIVQNSSTSRSQSVPQMHGNGSHH